jgi:hypothetical protein
MLLDILSRGQHNVFVALDSTGQCLTLAVPTGTCCFHVIWLRDKALDLQTRNPSTDQKMITLRDVPHDTRLVGIDPLAQPAGGDTMHCPAGSP